MKLTELKGAENLPEKTPHTYGRNITIDEYNQLEIDGDVEILAEIICPIIFGIEWGETVGSSKDTCRRHAKNIISNISKFLVIKKGG